MAEPSVFSADGTGHAPAAPTISSPAGHGHAVVIGGSMAGLLAARVLAAHFARVTVVERDRLPAAPAFRAGVPQSRHVHVLLARGCTLLERLFPGLVADLEAAGALPVDWPADVLWLTPAGWSDRFRTGLSILCCSRELLEVTVRRRLTALQGVRFLEQHDVVGLVASPDGRGVEGVALRARDGAPGSPATLAADLVVDASGRDSQTPRWLAALGYAPPAETRVNARLGYASRYYARPKGFRPDWQVLFFHAKPPTMRRGGALFPIEGDRWLVTLAGMGGDYPPTDEAGFLAFARSLRSPILYEAVRTAEPLSPIHGYRRTENQMRHYERLARWPERLLVVGDAVCAFNPIYGQGMTVAALSAATLHRCLREQARAGGLTRLGRRFQRAVAQRGATAWLMATGEDFRFPTTEGPRPGPATRLLQRYLDRVLAAATVDARVSLALGQVMNLAAPPATLLAPPIALRVLRALRARTPAAPPTATPLPAPATVSEAGPAV